MKKIKISGGYSGLNNSGITKFADDIAAKLENNANFPLAGGFVQALISENETLKQAIKNQKPGDKATTSAMHEAEDTVKALLKILASIVEYECKNDPTKALTSGFSLKATNAPTAQVFTIKQGKQSGAIDAVAPSYSRAAYVWKIASDPLGTWEQAAITTLSKFTFKNLTPGQVYWIKVAITQGEELTFTSDPHQLRVI